MDVCGVEAHTTACRVGGRGVCCCFGSLQGENPGENGRVLLFSDVIKTLGGNGSALLFLGMIETLAKNESVLLFSSVVETLWENGSVLLLFSDVIETLGKMVVLSCFGA